MDRNNLKEMIELHRRRLRELETIKTGCHSCTFFEARGRCDRWGQHVPTEHQPTGCDDWQYDFIPF